MFYLYGKVDKSKVETLYFKPYESPDNHVYHDIKGDPYALEEDETHKDIIKVPYEFYL